MTEIPMSVANTAAKVYRQGGTALVRSIGLAGVVLFGVQCIGLATSGELPFSTIAGLWPGANLVTILTIALVISILPAYTYAMIGTAAPGAGADYRLTSRTLGGALGFTSSWLMIIGGGLMIGATLNFMTQQIISNMLRMSATLFENDYLASLATMIASPPTAAVIGTVILVLAFFGAAASNRTVLRVLTIGLVLVLIAWAIIFFQLGTAPVSSFNVAWDKVMGPSSYAEHMTASYGAGMAPITNNSLLIIAGLVISFFVFFGYTISTNFAGEVKRPGRSLVGGSLISLVIAWAIFSGAVLLVRRIAPADWLSTESFLFLSGNYGTTFPWVSFYAAIQKPSMILFGLVFLGWVASMINMIQVYLFAFSRVLVAWADDRIMPEIVGYVHPTTKSPLVAILIVAGIIQIGMINSIQGINLSSSVGGIFFVICAMVIPVVAVTLYPFIKRSWFASNSGIVRLKIGPVPVISLVGALTLIYLGALIVLFIVLREPTFSLSTEHYFVLGGILLSGLVWYGVRARLLSREGIDLKETFKELPSTE